jgi:hypothetical protein
MKALNHEDLEDLKGKHFSTDRIFSRQFLWSDTAILVYLSLIKLILHLVANWRGGYGYFRDELYYIACSKHLAAGYVDQPPLSLYILALNRWLLGESLFALRFLPAVVGGVTVFLSGLMARESGGRRFAQVLAATATIICPSFLAAGSFYSMNCFDGLFWTLAAYATIRLIKRERPELWIVLGIVLGLGSLNKVGVLWLGFGLFVGILLSPQRRWLKTPWPWLAGVGAVALFSPFVYWNLTHDLAHLEFIRNATSGKYSGLSPLTFLLGQVQIHNPVTLPLWLAGLWFFFADREGRRFRPLGWMYVVPCALLILNRHSKPEYLSAAYPMLFAGGSVLFERWLAAKSVSWIKPVYVSLLVLGMVLAPIVIPILPVETYIRYTEVLGIKPFTPEGKKLAELHQFYADMFGWEAKAEAVAQVYNRLTPEEKQKCAIFADNYGRCGAIDFFGKAYGLPDAIGKHNNYWIWGPRDYTGELMIILGGELADKQQKFESVEVAGVVSCKYCMPYENNLRIYLCRKLKVSLKESWPRMKNFS